MRAIGSAKRSPSIVTAIKAAKDAIEAGVDSIEHGSFLKPETLQLMKPKAPISCRR